MIAAAQTQRHHQTAQLVVLAAELIDLARQQCDREMGQGWNASVSSQIDQLMVASECLAEFLTVERRRS